MKRLTAISVAVLALLVLSLAAVSQPAFAVTPCCAEVEFQGVGVPTNGVMIQLVEVKRVSPTDVRAT